MDRRGKLCGLLRGPGGGACSAQTPGFLPACLLSVGSGGRKGEGFGGGPLSATSGVGAIVPTWFERSKSGINQWSNFACPLFSAERRFPRFWTGWFRTKPGRAGFELAPPLWLVSTPGPRLMAPVGYAARGPPFRQTRGGEAGRHGEDAGWRIPAGFIWVGALSVGWESSDKEAEVPLGRPVSCDGVCSVLGETITHLSCGLHPLWVNKEMWAQFIARELIKPMEGLLHSRMVTIRAWNPQKLP